MDEFVGLFLLALAAAGLAFIAPIVALVKIGSLKERMRALEARIERLSQGAALAEPVRPLVEAEAPKAAEPPEVVEVDSRESGASHLIEEVPVAGASQDRALVFRPDRIQALVNWLIGHWVYVISAVSLAFAGVFLVQYGMEQGLLPPAARVGAALVLGLGLTGAGEYLRRRFGTRDDGAGQVPAVFSAAGIVTMFGAVVAARQLYGLIGAELAMVGLIAVALYALVLGWFNGAFLAGFGLVGAAVAPLIVGGNAESPYWLYGYYALVAGLGLGIDAFRRWAWVSVLALVLGFGGTWLILGDVSGGEGWFALAQVVLVLLALCVPLLSVSLRQAGPCVAEALYLRGTAGWPIFPVRLAAGTMLVACVGLVVVSGAGEAEAWVALACVAGLGVVMAVWSVEGEGLSDLAVVPVIGFWAGLVVASEGGLVGAFHAPELGAPWTASLLLALAVLVTLACAWRSLLDRSYAVLWGLAACLAAPVTAVILELFWSPARVIGPGPWALQVMALAGLMVGLAVRFTRFDDAQRRMAYAILSALSLIALALFVVVTQGALTLALAALLVVAVWLDRRFTLREMGWFVQAGVLVLGWRLVIDPGIDWAMDAPLWELWLAWGGALAGFFVALRGLPKARPGARAFLESGFAGACAIFADVLLARWFDGSNPALFLVISLMAFPPLVFMLAQLYRLKLADARLFTVLRWVLAGLGAVVAGLGYGSILTWATPLLGWLCKVQGPLVFDTLLLAYAWPGVVLIGAAQMMGHHRGWVRGALRVLGGSLVTAYIGFEIRRFWQGDDLSVGGVMQGELYSYTIAMMIAGGILLWQAIARRSRLLRLTAMGLIAVTIAKVFLIDASGLSGLTRVASFLGLGLALAGVAWLNRWASQGEVAKPE